MNIAYINGICVRNDAISQTIVDSMEALASDGAHLKLYTYKCDWPQLPSKVVRNSGEIVLDPWFRTVDVVAFHFGIFNPLFNVILALEPHRKALVRFHNITPKRYVAPSQYAIIDRSLAQIPNLRWADHIVCDSETNRETLAAHSITTPASVLPLAVRSPRRVPDIKPGRVDGIVRVVFIGRFVRAKGCADLLEAMQLVARESPDTKFQLDLIGNLSFASTDIVETLRSPRTTELDNFVMAVHGDASDAFKWDRLADADLFVLPTYHEGFCVPIVEAISMGCRVVSYQNSNVPFVSGDIATLVPTGDIRALADAIAADAALVRSPGWERDYTRYAERCQHHAAGYSKRVFTTQLVSLVHRVAIQPQSRHRARP